VRDPSRSILYKRSSAFPHFTDVDVARALDAGRSDAVRDLVIEHANMGGVLAGLRDVTAARPVHAREVRRKVVLSGLSAEFTDADVGRPLDAGRSDAMRNFAIAYRSLGGLLVDLPGLPVVCGVHEREIRFSLALSVLSTDFTDAEVDRFRCRSVGRRARSRDWVVQPRRD